jgi:hypothetical protein
MEDSTRGCLTMTDPPFRVDRSVIVISGRTPASLTRRAVILMLGVVLATAACASAAPSPPVPVVDDARISAPGFTFARDTFAFPNEIRARHPDAENLYANYCFVLARGLRQFFQFARFDPAAPKLDSAGYVERVRRLGEHAPWEPPLPPDERIIIPGYRNLREFSLAEAAAVKAGLGGRFWTWVHWTNWRVTFPLLGQHQPRIADEIARELRAGRLVQLLVTNWPVVELNHTVVAFAYRDTREDRVFDIWDPNDPAVPGTVTFERSQQRFWATRIYDTRPGPIRVFRMYYSRLL